MIYKQIIKGTFLKRPNRFIAHVMTENGQVICHVKNTGRLRELLYPGAQVILEYHPDAALLGRKTSYSLIGVYKEKAGIHGDCQLINIDSQAPNQAALEWVEDGFLSPYVKEAAREVKYGNSRFDLAYSEKGAPSFMEVKGVTLEQDGIAMFPDAPTERGVKHIMELIHAVHEGYHASILFVVQMKGVYAFTPNRATHSAFADALKAAAQAGVKVLAYDCIVTEQSMKIDCQLEVQL